MAFLFLGLATLTGCQNENTSQLSESDCISLIKRITEMPIKDGIEVEGDYYLVLEMTDKKEVANCLLSQITNTDATNLITAGPGPKPQFTVGDTSVFMLARMYDIPFNLFINDDDWSHMGIFAYYEFVEQDGARLQIYDKIEPIIYARFAA